MILNSAKLRKHRDTMKLTQEEIANHLGVSQTTVSEWEKKDSNVKLEHIMNLTKLLNIGIEDIVEESNVLIGLKNQVNKELFKNDDENSNIQAQIIDLQKDLIKKLKKQIILLEDELHNIKTSILKNS